MPDAERRRNTLSSSERPIRVLVAGRFQPVHSGHISLIEQALELGDVVIVVGSAEKGRSWDDPFTCRERLEMLKAAIKEKGWDASRFTIIPVEDIHSNELWVAKVEMLTPEFHTVMTGNRLVEHLFREKGYTVVRPKAFRPEVCSGRYIREKLRAEKSLSPLRSIVPPSVSRIINKPDVLRFISSQKR